MSSARHPSDALHLMQSGDWAAALELIEHALTARPGDPSLLMQSAQCLLRLGRRDAAMSTAQAAEKAATAAMSAPAATAHGAGAAAIRDAAGTLYSYAHEHRRAFDSYDAALALSPGNAHYLYNRASVRRFLGDLAGAEQDYDAVIQRRPADYEAYKQRSDLRTQSPQRNHVAELEALLSRPQSDWRAEVQLRYALAKEHEDLEQYRQSFLQLSRGARVRRQHMRYDIGNDLATVQWIIDAFPRPLEASPVPAHSADAPIFVLGLPRSGTTLVERILDSHSQVSSVGELDCFAAALMSAVRARSGLVRQSRQAMVAASAALDFRALGADYLARARAESGVRGRFIDKMPLNYLYCGLLQRALPAARLIHVERHPMAVCYAMYKALFKDAYPFSYELTEIAQYYLGYRRLMAHWHAALPGRIHTVHYEQLIADQDGEIRRLLGFCGLDWQAACAQSHTNPAPSTTASSAQVRQPLYHSSLSQWRHYEHELGGLRKQLEAAGVDI